MKRALYLTVVLAVCVFAQSGRDAYRSSFRAWREADPALERDAAMGGAAIADRAGREAPRAAKYGEERSAFLKQLAGSDEKIPKLESVAAVEPPAPSLYEDLYLAGETAFVRRDIETFAKDPDKGLQLLRQSLEHERTALAALSDAVTARHKVRDEAMDAAQAAEEARVKALGADHDLASGLKETAEQFHREADSWGEYYRILADAAQISPNQRGAIQPAAPNSTTLSVGPVGIGPPNPGTPGVSAGPATAGVSADPGTAAVSSAPPNSAVPSSATIDPAATSSAVSSAPPAVSPAMLPAPALPPTAPVAETSENRTAGSTSAEAPVVSSQNSSGRNESASRPSPSEIRPLVPSITPVPLVRYVGSWIFPASNGTFQGAEPESVELSVTEEGGHATGAFLGRFKLPTGTTGDPALRLHFAGDFKSTLNQTFALETSDGATGTIELVPGSAFNLLEVTIRTVPKPGKINQASMVLVKK